MINFLGKFLVFFHTLASLAAMTWALGLYLQFIDWGWKEPKQDLESRIPSEYEKSMAALKQAVRTRDLVLPLVAPAQASLVEAEAQYPRNHLFYIKEIEKLRGEPLLPGKATFVDDKTFAAFELKGGLDTGKVTGKPAFDAKIDTYTKPIVAYRADLAKVREEGEKEEKKIEEVLKETQQVTHSLTGMDDTGKKITMGLYDLVDAEYELLTLARRELEELKPVWAQSLEEARLYTLRRANLEQALAKLKAAAAAKR